MSLADRAAARREQRAQEMARGRKTTKMHMAVGLLDQLASEFKLPRTYFVLNSDFEDVRLWTITLQIPEADPITEDFFTFPSPELRATIALMQTK